MDPATTMEFLREHGAIFAKAEDQHGDTKSGWWVPGDEPYKPEPYGFLGETCEDAVAAYVG